MMSSKQRKIILSMATLFFATFAFASNKLGHGSIREIAYNNLIHDDRWMLILDGFFVTIIISFFSIISSVLLGAVFCRLSLSSNKKFTKVFDLILNFLSSLPPLIILMLMVYWVFAKLPVSIIFSSVVAYSILFGAFYSRVFKSGLASVDNGQWEAAYALGMSRFQTFFKVVLPQMLIKVLPLIKSNTAFLIKATSFVGYASLVDLTMAGYLIRSRTFNAFFALLTVALLYFLLTSLANVFFDLLYRRLTKHMKAS